MNHNLKSAVSSMLLAALVNYYSASQPVVISHDSLKLTDLGRRIENYVSFNTTSANFENIKAVTGQKIIVKATSLVINGDTLSPEEIKTRGQTTLYFRRKSYSFSLNSNALLRHGKKKESLKKFYALSLSMDRDYRSNRLAFEMMKTAGLFNLFYAFCELRINGQSEGICMLVERPEDWALKKKDSPLVIRRGYNSSIDKIKTGKKTDKEQTQEYRNNFRQIYRSINRFHGEELYRELSGWLDMDSYLKWLAFNYFVRNGDYTDEVYFYVDPHTKKFSIIPWDYDDLFSASPHEGYTAGRKILGSKVIFSTEDLLDKKIASDPFLYKKYLEQFRALLNDLTPEVLKSIFENTFAELYPYYKVEEIINNSNYDLYKGDNLEKLKNDLLSLYDMLIISRNISLQYLDSKSITQ